MAWKDKHECFVAIPIDTAFSVYDELQTSLVGILPAWRCIAIVGGVLCAVARSGGARRSFTRLQLYVQRRRHC